MTNILTPQMAMLVDLMKRHAGTGILRMHSPQLSAGYFDQATRPHIQTGSLLMFTRDSGYYTSGEVNSALYDRCYHLSISFKDFSQQPPTPREFDPVLARVWAEAFYADWMPLVWVNNNNAYRTPQLSEVHHYRVFCDSQWQPLILPSDIPEFRGKWVRWTAKRGNE